MICVHIMDPHPGGLNIWGISPSPSGSDTRASVAFNNPILACFDRQTDKHRRQTDRWADVKADRQTTHSDIRAFLIRFKAVNKHALNQSERQTT